MSEKVIGILGGQGPEATLDLFRRILQNTPAQTDQEHFHVIIDCNPKVPNPNNAVTKGTLDPTPMLCETARNLASAGVDFIVIPCNTVHIFLPAIRSAINIPVLSIIDAAISALRETAPFADTVGVLASPAVTTTGLYARALQEHHIQALSPDSEGMQQLHDIIFAVKAGNKSQEIKENVLRLAHQLIQDGAKAIILGCTELPLLLTPQDLPVPVIDTLEVLAQAAIRTARSKKG